MRQRVKKTISVLLLIVTLISLLPISSIAIEGGGNTGGGYRGTTGGKGDWGQLKEGYRFVVVDRDFNEVSNVVDIVFSEPRDTMEGSNYWYKNTRASKKGLSTEIPEHGYKCYTIDKVYATDVFLGENKPYPPIWYKSGESTARGWGEEFRQWFIEDATSLGSYTPPVPSGGGGGGGGTPYYPPYNPNEPEEENDDDEVIGLPYENENINTLNKLEKRNEVIAVLGGYVGKRLVDAHLNSLTATIITLKSSGVSNSEIAMAIWNNTWSISTTPAYRVYIFCLAISKGMGIIDYFNSGDETTEGKMTGVQASNQRGIQELYEKIPLANSEKSLNGYHDELINCVVGGRYLFEIEGNTKDDGMTPLEYIQYNGYNIIVEPLFWYKPASTDYKMVWGDYVYGTVANMVDFLTENPLEKAEYGGYYGVTLGWLGHMCMEATDDLLDKSGNVVIRGLGSPTPVGTHRKISEMYDMIHNGKYGIAMHVYTTDESEEWAYTRTWDRKVIGPGKAPEFDAEALNLDPEKLDTNFRIIKYYEYETGEVIEDSPYIRTDVPGYVIIEDEIYKDDVSYVVKEWFTSSTNKSAYRSYIASKNSYNDGMKSGTSAGSLIFDEGDITLFMLLVPTKENIEEDSLRLYESQISKAVFTGDTTVSNWGPIDVSITCSSMEASAGYMVDDIPVTIYAVFGDSSYKYIIENAALINDKLEADKVGGIFKSYVLNNEKSGNVGLGGGTNTLSSVAYRTAIWRGLDIPTLASYKVSSSSDIARLIAYRNNIPANKRASSNRSYTLDLDILLRLSNLSDTQTYSINPVTGGVWVRGNHYISSGNTDLNGDVTVDVYAGNGSNKSIGNEHTTGIINTKTPFGSNISGNSTGYMVRNTKPIKFYPYIQMTYQGSSGGSKIDTYVLSENISEILPNDFAEAAWFNSGTVSGPTLNMSSNQWSIHAKATEGDDGWQGRNQVLPGGAMYTLTTKENSTRVALVTWQTIVTGTERSNLASTLNSNEYTMSSAENAHKEYVNTAIDTIESLRVVQWVNADVNATNAWDDNGKSVVILEPETDLSSLGLNNKSSAEQKHQITADIDGRGNGANEGDLDIINNNALSNTYFKVFSDTSGNIYLAKSIGSLEALSGVNGTQTYPVGDVTVTKILDKSVKWEDVSSMLTGEAEELNTRTLIITNFVKSLERNSGRDITASWVSDGKWYNEAWDGIIVVRQSNLLEVGFGNPGIRSAALDPNLSPMKSGTSDYFTKAFLSQFRVNTRSESESAEGKPDRYIGTFKGQDITLKNMEMMYTSKRFFIPNVNVQDLD